MSKEEIIRKTAAILNERRTEAETLARESYLLALQDETFENLDRQHKALMMQIAKARAYGENCAELTAQSESVKSSMDARLAELNLDTKPKYACKKCNDSGYSNDGTPCGCYRNLYHKLLKESCNLNSLAEFTFEQNNLPQEAKQSIMLGKLYTKMQLFCNNFPASKYNIFLFSGEMGVGKTCLISAIANRILERGFSVLYLTAFELNDLFLKYHTGAIENRSVLKDIIDCDLLIIDDLGTEPSFKNVTVEYLFNVLNTRINNSKHVIISTNLSLDELLDRYGERIYSRLTAKNNIFAVRISGDDLRKK